MGCHISESGLGGWGGSEGNGKAEMGYPRATWWSILMSWGWMSRVASSYASPVAPVKVKIRWMSAKRARTR